MIANDKKDSAPSQTAIWQRWTSLSSSPEVGLFNPRTGGRAIIRAIIVALHAFAVRPEPYPGSRATGHGKPDNQHVRGR
jgi:hypothetical protein